MPRKRFTQIIDKTNNVIPIGGEAQNITLKDGSVLEQALGEINLAKNGSIIDQINKLKTDTLAGEYAPLVSPAIQRTFAVQQDYISYNPSLTTNDQTRTKDGITIKRKSANSYEFSGTFVLDSSSTSTSSLIAISGSGANVSNIGSNGDYTYIIKTNFLKQGLFSIEFYHNSTASTSESNIEGTSIYITEDMLEGQGSTKTVKGTFTVPSGHKLCRVALRAHSAAQGAQINNGNTGSLIIYLYKKNTFSVFKISKSSENWNTSIAGNLIVKKYQEIEPRSSLGTIYNSSWEDVLRINSNTSDKKGGVLVQNSGIGFTFNNFEQTFYRKGVTNQTPYHIFAKPNPLSTQNFNQGIYYDTPGKHFFRIYSNNKYTHVLSIGSQIDFLTPVNITERTTISGPITISSNLTLKGKVTNEGSFRSPDVPISKEIKTMKELEAIIYDDNGKGGKYPLNQIIVFRLHPVVVYYLTKNKNVEENKVPSSVKSCIGMGFKTSHNNMHLFYVGEDRIYKTQYYWPEGKYTTNNNRNFKTYSVRLATDELLSKPVNGRGIKF